MTSDEPQPLLTFEQVCRWLGISERHLRALVARREIPVHRVGRLLRFDQTRVQSWLDGDRGLEEPAEPFALTQQQQRRQALAIWDQPRPE